ncbi:16S rRNA (guanine(527)-N(7))-methyltransferase RsmG [Ramlibacter humi]|uniref:Ribosomal RNA small subunit methyltransferase G n=1 Tax=Ramlibacter humi TaxID=2530451 RepID=A0A4Z0BV33_9BURK|nr:16S rRNA (guanine(527)-N(7))-methyltransferase RsmG [Ramlibacter humi]TFZ01885.1 16S rRNA (guanine(527)-N(7))-methyltransferase RsmG [Ramlibacter humi]
MSLAVGLAAGLRELGLGLDEARQQQLLAYLDLLAKWNKVYNLTAVRDPAEMLTHHLLDSLAVIEPLRRRTGGAAARVLDVGSGGGLPGVVIAICCPQLQVDCVDTVGKKAAFIQQAAVQLQLPNLRGVHDRAEKLAGQYEVITSRAFATLADFVAVSRETLEAQGLWMAMKGKHPDAELASLPGDVAVVEIEPLRVPGLGAERCIVWMRQAAAGA